MTSDDAETLRIVFDNNVQLDYEIVAQITGTKKTID
jgi:hypothetical protein